MAQKKKVFMLHMSLELHEKLKQLSTKSGKSMTQLLNEAISKVIEKEASK